MTPDKPSASEARELNDQHPFPDMLPASTEALLERLHKVWDDAGKGKYRCLEEPTLCKAAADEIERLRASTAPPQGGEREAERITGASDELDEAACLIWAELCPGMMMGDEDRAHYEAAAKAVLALRSPAATVSEDDLVASMMDRWVHENDARAEARHILSRFALTNKRPPMQEDGK